MACIKSCVGFKPREVLRKMPPKALPTFSLYNSCLRTISLLLIKRGRKSRQENPFQLMPSNILQKISLLLIKRVRKSIQENPFQLIPSKILQDLVTTTLDLQNEDGFTAASLEVLLTSGNIRQIKMQSKCLIQELVLALKYLTTACQNLEVLELTELFQLKYTDEQRASMTELVRNSPNLKYIHSEVNFDLKALRQCKKLKTVMLHFNPTQPMCDFLEDEKGSFQSLESLEIFTVCFPSHHLDDDDLITILQHCPALISLGLVNTSRVLAKLHRTGVLSKVKLRCCLWGRSRQRDREPEWIRDAIIYHPVVEELYIIVNCIENIASLSSLRNLVFLDIEFLYREDLFTHFNNVLQHIGHQLKYLFLTTHGAECQVDISMSLQNCANLEVLLLDIPKFSEFAKPSITLPNLKCLIICCSYPEVDQRLLSLLLDCNNLKKLSTGNLVDETLDTFLERNSLSNLKAASFMPCRLTKIGFKKLFLNAPELKIIEAANFSSFRAECALEKDVKTALLETNHKALFNDYILRRRDPCGYHENQFGIFDEFIFKKRGCYLFN